jgi:hypothetical protein
MVARKTFTILEGLGNRPRAVMQEFCVSSQHRDHTSSVRTTRPINAEARKISEKSKRKSS